MPEIKNTFLQSKMNKDLDARLIPNGQYRDAQNINVNKSEGADVGAVENVLGNIEITSFGATSDKCEIIGYYTETTSDTITSTVVNASNTGSYSFYKTYSRPLNTFGSVIFNTDASTNVGVRNAHNSLEKRDASLRLNQKYDYSNHPYFNKMTLHHSAGWAATTLEEGKAAVKSIQRFHQDGRGWSDIGYHFLVDMGGNIYQGRPETVLGAHVGGANTGNIGVCILGCYHPPESSIPCYDEMTYNSEQSLIQLYAWISDTYGMEPKILKGHRDYFGTTSCPGNNVWSKLPQLRSEISLYIMYGFQPTRFALFQNYPNPFNSSTTLHYDLPEPSNVVISIYDILGSEIIKLVNQQQHYGYKKIVWDGKNQAGDKVAPGVYFYKATLGDLEETKKMILLK